LEGNHFAPIIFTDELIKEKPIFPRKATSEYRHISFQTHHLSLSLSLSLPLSLPPSLQQAEHFNHFSHFRF
jgi:hypothetical protein